MGMTRYRRCKSLGEDYSEECIRERIVKENLSSYEPLKAVSDTRIVRCRIKRYRRAKLSGIQKRYFARLYRAGLLQKRPYSQVWKYRDDIRRMEKLQEDYLFLSKQGINSAEDVKTKAEAMTDKKKEIAREKSRIFKERARMKPLFDLMLEMQGLQECENCYGRGGKPCL